MNTESLRPSVDQLCFRVYDRPLHPDLIVAVCTRRIAVGEMVILLRLTATGHVISFETHDLHLTEITASADEPLPVGGQLVSHRLHGEQEDTVIPGSGYYYRANSQVEVLPQEVFRHAQEEIALEAVKGALAHTFDPGHRLAPAPLGLLVHETDPHYISIAAFHTFPEELTIVKTQTLLERI